MDIKFYILIPVYNSELFLHKCIGSILSQTYQNYEVVLVNDGSCDKSGVICDKYAQTHTNIHVIHQENKGPVATRSEAEKYVLEHHYSGEAFIIHVDSDDTIDAKMLESLAQLIVFNNPDMVIYNYRRLTMDGDLVVEQSDTGDIEKLSDKRIVYRRLFFDESYNPLWRKAINIRTIKFVDHSAHLHIKHGEDLLRSLDYLKSCEKILFYDKVLYNYVINEASITRTKKYEQYIVNTTVRKMVLDFLQEENVFLPEDYKDYWLFIQTQLHREIKLIAYMSISNSEKIELYKKIRADYIWNESLSIESKYLIVKLFKREKYKIILFLYRLRKFFAKIKAAIKK